MDALVTAGVPTATSSPTINPSKRCRWAMRVASVGNLLMRTCDASIVYVNPSSGVPRMYMFRFYKPSGRRQLEVGVYSNDLE